MTSNSDSVVLKAIFGIGSILLIIFLSFLNSVENKSFAEEASKALVTDNKGFALHTTVFNNETSTIMLTFDTDSSTIPFEEKVEGLELRVCRALNLMTPKNALYLVVKSKKKGDLIYSKN
ncbi:hypothetical protein [Pleionea sediminis]|uniref:hypothetical protein n=1 Tax=Pleionea sediminis TaxID=2569479 RepID=UPI0013DE241E|nr:hypothetical protein [Pleionea sediminis]